MTIAQPAILTEDDKLTLATAAHGAVTLLSAAGARSASRIATAGSMALYAATGLVGHALADSKNPKLAGKSTADVADQVLPALTASMRLLRRKAPAEADNFRATVSTAIEAAGGAERHGPSPAVTAMTGKILAALEAN